MIEADVAALLKKGWFAEAAYFAVVRVMKSPNADAHMIAGVSCCGCGRPLAIAQRLLEGEPVLDEDLRRGYLATSPIPRLPYEGLFHLLQAIRLEPSIRAPLELRNVFDSVADDLAFVSRRDLERPPNAQARYTFREATLAAALLLRRLTGTQLGLAGVFDLSIQRASKIIDFELAHPGGDASFF